MVFKQKVKKLIAIPLIAGLLVGVFGSTAMAKSFDSKSILGVGQGGIKINTKLLKDIRGHWAEEILTEMNLKGLIKGYDDQNFKPSNVVKNVEAIVMLIRAMDLEDETEKITIKLNDRVLKDIPEWAHGYIQVAVNEGVLKEEELKKFNPNQPVTRAELSTYIVRALDLQDDALADFELKFFDTKDIPQYLTGYVGLLVQNGIMKGLPGNLFQPNKPIERAEMAVLLERLKEGFFEEDFRRVDGVFYSIDQKKEIISISTTKNTIKKFEYDEDDLVVYLDGKKSSLKELKVGDRLRLTMDDDEVVLIRAYRAEAAEITYSGSIIQLVFGSEGSITIRDKNKDFSFNVDATTQIMVNGKRSFLMDLKTGQQAVVTARGDKAISIDIGQPPREESYEGILAGIHTGINAGIKIRNENGERLAFKPDEQTKIYLDGKETSFDKLSLGLEVQVVIKEGIIVKIEAKSISKGETFEGIIKGITIGNNQGVVILTDNNKQLSFTVDEKTKISLKGKSVSFDKIKLNYRVKVVAEDKKALEIEAWEK